MGAAPHSARRRLRCAVGRGFRRRWSGVGRRLGSDADQSAGTWCGVVTSWSAAGSAAWTSALRAAMRAANAARAALVGRVGQAGLVDRQGGAPLQQGADDQTGQVSPQRLRCGGDQAVQPVERGGAGVSGHNARPAACMSGPQAGQRIGIRTPRSVCRTVRPQPGRRLPNILTVCRRPAPFRGAGPPLGPPRQADLDGWAASELGHRPHRCQIRGHPSRDNVPRTDAKTSTRNRVKALSAGRRGVSGLWSWRDVTRVRRRRRQSIRACAQGRCRLHP